MVNKKVVKPGYFFRDASADHWIFKRREETVIEPLKFEPTDYGRIFSSNNNYSQ